MLNNYIILKDDSSLYFSSSSFTYSSSPLLLLLILLFNNTDPSTLLWNKKFSKWVHRFIYYMSWLLTKLCIERLNNMFDAQSGYLLPIFNDII